MKMDTKTTASTNSRAHLIAALRHLQEAHGYLPEKALRDVSADLGIPLSHTYGVVTFFSEFSLERRGRNNVCVCRGSACGVKGGKEVLKAVTDVIGVGEGETSADYEYSLQTVSCFGNCAVAPAMLVNKDLYGDLTPERVKIILDPPGGGGDDE